MRKLWNSGVNLFSMLTAPSSRAPSNPPTGNGHDFEFTGIDGAPLKLSAWRGRPLLIVNTASLCGFTKQYGDLQELWRRYESAGLIVIAVPSNDFGEQEPDADGEIRAFCQGVFGVTFPIASKQPSGLMRTRSTSGQLMPWGREERRRGTSTNTLLVVTASFCDRSRLGFRQRRQRSSRGSKRRSSNPRPLPHREALGPAKMKKARQSVGAPFRLSVSAKTTSQDRSR